MATASAQAQTSTNFPPTGYPIVPIEVLHHIRILELHPGRRTDKVKCTLVVQRLELNSNGDVAALRYPGARESQTEKSPSLAYSALSYCWGTFDDHAKIQLNEIHDFPVSANLHAALRRLREKDGRQQRFWIDQTCINQHDIRERSCQVSIMANIFNQAQQVLVWLGDTSSDTSPRMLAHWRLQKQLFEALAQRPHWWTRAWVVPGFLAARTEPVAIFGPCSMPWSKISDLEVSDWSLFTSHWLLDDQNCVYDRMYSLHKLKTLCEKSKGSLTLASFGSVLLQTTCLDSRDKVYSLLGFVSDLRGFIQPDYAANISQVFAMATYATIGASMRLNVLSLIFVGKKRKKQDLPTWAVDFDFRESRSLPPRFSPEGDLFGANYSISGFSKLLNTKPLSWCRKRTSTKALPTYDADDPQTLVLRGLTFDTIAFALPLRPRTLEVEKGPSSPSEGGMTDAIRSRNYQRRAKHDRRFHDRALLSDEEKVLCHTVLRTLDGAQPFEMLGRRDSAVSFQNTAIANELEKLRGMARTIRVTAAISLFESWSQGIAKSKPADFSWYDPWWYKSSWNSGAKLSMVHGMAIWDNYFDFASDGRALFVTETGFLGLSQKYAREGDRVILPFGSRMPILLRPSKENWQFEGFVYVNGIMDEELQEWHPDILLREDDYPII